MLVAPAFANNGEGGDVHDCDREVAHPSDPDKVVDGVGSGDVVTHRAIPACRAAVEAYPDVARFHYQLGRAIVYWAGANDGNMDEGLQHLEHAAEMKHEQSEFVLGLMRRTLGNVCASEPLTKRAADQGLKSARITYVNATLAGDYDDCGISASDAEMRSLPRRRRRNRCPAITRTCCLAICSVAWRCATVAVTANDPTRTDYDLRLRNNRLCRC